MNGTYIVYGAPGSGSVPIEAALALLHQPYRVEDYAPWESPEHATEFSRINPMVQVPALVAPRLAGVVRRVDADPRADEAVGRAIAFRGGLGEVGNQPAMPRVGVYI